MPWGGDRMGDLHVSRALVFTDGFLRGFLV